MSYNAKLEGLIDAAAGRCKNVEIKKMFGGVDYPLKGNMCFGIYKEFLIVRMDKEPGFSASVTEKTGTRRSRLWVRRV